MTSSINFDYDHLRDLLLPACRTAFTSLQQAHPAETFYTFALYTSPEYSYLFITANTEEGLTRTAQSYLDQDAARGWYTGISIAEMGAYVRHSPSDNEYHCPPEYDDLFEEINDLLEDHRIQVFNLWNAVADEQGHQAASQTTQPYRQKIVDICLNTLQKLDEAGVFTHREHALLQFYMGDQSELERLYFAKQLNHPRLVVRYQQDLADEQKIAERIGENRG